MAISCQQKYLFGSGKGRFKKSVPDHFAGEIGVFSCMRLTQSRKFWFHIQKITKPANLEHLYMQTKIKYFKFFRNKIAADSHLMSLWWPDESFHNLCKLTYISRRRVCSVIACMNSLFRYFKFTSKWVIINSFRLSSWNDAFYFC